MKNLSYKTKLVRNFILFSLLTVNISCTTNKKVVSGDINKNVEVSAAFEKVFKAIQTAVSEAKVSDKFKLTGIELTFSEVKTFEVDGKAKFFVSAEYSHSRSNSNKSTFKFGPPPPIKKMDLIAFKSKNFKPKDDKFIKYLEQVLESADEIRNLPNFGLNELEVEVEFKITNKGTLGVDFELAPVEIGSTVSREKEVTHSVTITFEKIQSGAGN